MGGRATDRKTLEPVLKRLEEGAAAVRHRILEGTRLFQPPATSTLRGALERLLDPKGD